jgi:hypothetical protein
MYFGPSISVGRRGVSYGDSDAQAFIAATGLTGTTEVNAVNNLVANLKSYGLWSKMKAIYPFVSDTYNLLSYTSDYANAYWTKNAITLTQNATTAPDGTNTGNKITETAVTSGHWLKTILSLTAGSTYTISGYFKAAERQYAVLIDDDAGLHTAYFNLLTGTLVSQSGYTSTSITSVGNGWFRCSATRNASSSLSNFYWAISSNGTTYNYLGDGTSGIYTWGFQFEQSSTLSTYQEITTTPAARFVSQFKYNLKDPRDLNAAFRLSFNGTWTYTQNGALPNGVNAYANTYLNPVANSLTSASSHLSYYARTASTTADSAEIANFTNANEAFVLQSKSGSGLNRFFFTVASGASRSVATAPTGLMAGSSVTNTRRDLYFNGVSVANNTTTDTATLGNYNLYLAAGNIGGLTIASYSNAQAAFATIGIGLTSTQMANLYTSVQDFQIELSRQV